MMAHDASARLEYLLNDEKFSNGIAQPANTANAGKHNRA